MILYFVLLFLLKISSSAAQNSQNISELSKIYNNIGHCVPPNAGLCIAIQECSVLLSILLKSTLSRTDIDVLQQSFCGYHQNKPMVCCPTNSPKTLSTTTTVKPPARLSQDEPPARRRPGNPTIKHGTQPPLIHIISNEPPTSSQSSSGAIPYNGESYHSEVRTKTVSLPQPGICGASLTDRIIGGVVSNIDEYPWIALLVYKKSDDTTSFNCAGALINERYVLTAAHCLKNVPGQWSLDAVRLGEYDISTDADCLLDDVEFCSDPVIDIPIEKIIPHAGYSQERRKMHHDIGLIRLSKPVSYTRWVKPICLPTSDKLRNSNFVNQTMQIAGWGRTELASKSNVRLKASITVVGGRECQEAYVNANIEIRDSQICAGGKSVDSCAGDSGGPLMGVEYDKQPYFFLAGIISFGTKPCAMGGIPGIYTRVGAYIDWIESNMEP